MRRRGYALLVALALLALGMGAAVVMLKTSDLSVRSTTRDDLKRRADGAAQSAVELGIDVIRRRSWSGVNWEFAGSWLDGAAFRVRYLPGDASLTSGSADYAYYPYRVTIEATATVSDPSEPAAVTTSVATAVVELMPKKLQGALSGYGDRNDYAYYQLDRFNSTGEVRLEPPFQFVGTTRFNDQITDWCADYFNDDARRQPYLSGLRTMAQAGTERRPFVGSVEYRLISQPSKLRTDVTSRLGQTEVNVTPDLEWAMPSASTSTYQLYPGGPVYAMPSFNATYGSNPQNLAVASDPISNPLGLFRMSSSVTFKNDVKVAGMLMASDSSVSLNVDGSRCSIEPPKAMNLNSRTLELSLPALCVTNDFNIRAASDDLVIRGAVICWDEFLVEGGSAWQDVLIEGGLQSHQAWIKGRSDFKLSNGQWSAALMVYNATDKLIPFPVWLETMYGLPSEPSIKIRKDVTGATAKHVFDPSQALYDYPDATSGLTWRVVRMTPPS
ncbi:MAG TPA: hypothetical protein VGN57_16740 [Pirellulaceae bacterium]|nr:hypothetical protein [Pirellulaceae bacterium]